MGTDQGAPPAFTKKEGESSGQGNGSLPWFQITGQDAGRANNNNEPPTSNINWKKQPGRGDGHLDPDLSGSDSSDNWSNSRLHE